MRRIEVPPLSRVCKQCGQTKDAADFSWKDGSDHRRLTARCRACIRDNYKENPTRAKERANAYYLNNKEECLKKGREYRERNAELVLWRGARQRARKYHLHFNIEPWEVCIPRWCPVLGIYLKVSVGQMCDASPTLDRIDGERGYVHDNVIVVSAKANTIKSNATPEEIQRVATFYKNLWREMKAAS